MSKEMHAYTPAMGLLYARWCARCGVLRVVVVDADHMHTYRYFVPDKTRKSGDDAHPTSDEPPCIPEAR